MSWEAFYLGCFILGLLLSLVSLLGGVFHVHVPHVHAHFHLPGAHAASNIAHGSSIAPVNGFTLTAFLCWFGGTGYLLERTGTGTALLVLLCSALSGTAAGAVVFWVLVRVLLPLERPLTAEESDMRGVVGVVSGTVHADGTGEVLFSQGGARRSAPARSESGERIAKGAEVVVLRYEKGIAYVRRWDEVGDELALGTDGHTQREVL